MAPAVKTRKRSRTLIYTQDDVPHDEVTQEIPEEVPKEVFQQVPEEVPVTQEVPEEVPVTQEVSQQVPKEVPEETTMSRVIQFTKSVAMYPHVSGSVYYVDNMQRQSYEEWTGLENEEENPVKMYHFNAQDIVYWNSVPIEIRSNQNSMMKACIVSVVDYVEPLDVIKRISKRMPIVVIRINPLVVPLSKTEMKSMLDSQCVKRVKY
jgi:hypothetical protein